jgi:putative ABC transport system permease protein
MTGYPLYGAGFGMPFTIAGEPAYTDPSKRPNSGFGMVTPDYFSTLGVQVESGRAFTAQDTADSVKVAMVNESFVKTYFKGRDPLQQRVVVEQIIPGEQKLGPPIEWQVVGVYHDVHAADWHNHLEEILVPFWQIPWPQATVAVRTAEKPLSMLHSIAAAVHQVDPTVALAQPESVEQIRDESMAGERFTLTLFGVFAAVALFLAALGIYGVMAFSVAQRSHEIALRMALGAGRGRVVAVVMREGAVLAGAGLVLGLIGAYFVGRAMQSILFDVHALDGAAFSAVGVVLLAAAMLACYLPAHRAASIEPMRVLRTE